MTRNNGEQVKMGGYITTRFPTLPERGARVGDIVAIDGGSPGVALISAVNGTRVSLHWLNSDGSVTPGGALIDDVSHLICEPA